MPNNAWNSIRSFAARVSLKVKSIFSPPPPSSVQSTPIPTPSSPGLDLGQVANPLFSGTETTPGNTYQQGGWMLVIYYRNRGSRSQGQHGVLFKDGVEVKPRQVGEILQTDLGDLKYVMHPEDMTFLWDITGWVFVG